MEGLGVEGDAHAGPFVRHRHLARRRPKMPNLRQVHLIPSELFQALRADGYELRPGDLGENILTAGLDLEALPLGTILKLGAEAAIGRISTGDAIAVRLPSEPLKSLPAL